ncbi:MAG TPA: MBL fold metallo-hydrolase [Planctomycetota bacterium]|nr:MBL fold metallo-hydrolase [Planctomycetota bacterium]
MAPAFRIGSIEVHRLDDGPFWLDGGQMFGIVPKVLWSKECPVDADNRMAMACNCYLLISGGRRTLVDAGLGRDWDDKSRRIYGVDASAPTLLDRLGALGLGPGDIDRVLLTHLHFDHCGWATVPDGSGGHRPTFPNAEHLVHRLEWDDAHDPEARGAASYFDRLYDPLKAAGQLRLLEGGPEFALGQGLEALVTGGHTRGHLAWMLESQGHRAIGLADLCPLAAHRRERWLTAFDLYPVEALAVKRRLLGAAEAGNWAVFLNHEPDRPARRPVRRSAHLDLDPLEAGIQCSTADRADSDAARLT